MVRFVEILPPPQFVMISKVNRKGIFIVCFVAAFLFYDVKQANAQDQVTRGSVHHYSVAPFSGSPAYDYYWSVTPGGTISDFGISDTTNDILWDGATGLYTISVYPTHQVTGCAGNNEMLSINVVEMNIMWASNSSTQCPGTDNQSGDFTLNADYIGIIGAWSFKYSIDAGAEQIVNVASGNSVAVNISGFVNPSVTTPAIHTIRISQATSSDKYTAIYSGSESDAAARLYTVTIDPTPNTSGIIQF